MTVLKLTHAIKHGDNELTELDLREPTAKDIREIGCYPVDLSNGSVNAEAVYKYAVRLAALPPSVIDKISASDFMQVVTPGILTFFVDGQE